MRRYTRRYTRRHRRRHQLLALLLLALLTLPSCVPTMSLADAEIVINEATRHAQGAAHATRDKIAADEAAVQVEARATRLAAEAQATADALSVSATRDQALADISVAREAEAATVSAEQTRAEQTVSAEYATAEHLAAAAQLNHVTQMQAQAQRREATANTLRVIRNAALAVLVAVLAMGAVVKLAVYAYQQRSAVVIVPTPSGSPTGSPPGTPTVLVRHGTYQPLGNGGGSQRALPHTIPSQPQWNAIPNPPVGFGLEALQRWRPGDGVALGVVNGKPLRLSHAALEGAFPHVLVCARSGAGKSFTMLRPMVASMLNDGRMTVVLADQTFKDFRTVVGHPNLIPAYLETPHALIALIAATYDLIMARGRELAAHGEETTTWGRYMASHPVGQVPGRVAVVVDEYNNLLRELPRREAQELARLTDMVASRGRASGVHLIAGVQDPTKEDFPKSARRNMVPVALRLQDASTSRLVLGQDGAERLGRGQFLVVRNGVPVAGNTFVLNAQQLRQTIEGDCTPLPDPGLEVTRWTGQAPASDARPDLPAPIITTPAQRDARVVLPFVGQATSRTAMLDKMEEAGVAGWNRKGANVERITAALLWIAEHGEANQQEAVRGMYKFPWEDRDG